MAFVSQIGRKYSSGAYVRFRKTNSGAGGGTISKEVPLRGERIDIQIDEGEKKIRLGVNVNGVSCGPGGSFSCSLAVLREVGGERIALTDGGDGWWYGDYSGGK
nr:MAG TPA: hypothetical protein [Caudoviricetes sp.]